MKSKAFIVTEDLLLQSLPLRMEKVFIDSPHLVAEGEAERKAEHQRVIQQIRDLPRPLQKEQVLPLLEGYPDLWSDFRPRCNFCGDLTDRVLCVASEMSETITSFCESCYRRLDLWESGGSVEIETKHLVE